jgi:hypothetical protein
MAKNIVEAGSCHVRFEHGGFWVYDEDAPINPVEGFESEDARLAFKLASGACRSRNADKREGA